MTYAIEPVFFKATSLLDREGKRLQALEQARPHLSNHPFDPDGVSAMSRALTFVICGGILERLMRDLPPALSLDLISLKVQRNELPVGLLATLEASEFRKCANQDAGALSVRARLVKSIVSHRSDSRSVTDFGADLILADGKTVNSKQFSALWDILNLPGDWRSEPNDLLLLRELQSKRNDVAHWEQDPVKIGRSRSYRDLQDLTKALGRLLDHVYLHLCEWLDGYKKVSNG
jgi:hypothetical protein